MAKVKVTVKFQLLEFLDRFVDGATANAIGGTVVDKAKEMISSGQSPVRGIGRYIRYADSYRGMIKRKHPQGKNITPVNLNLTGKMLDEYTFERVSDKVVRVGFVKETKSHEIARYHTEGNEKMPSRPLVPSKNEEWAVSIMQAIKDIYGKRLADLIKKSNKRSTG